MKDSYAFYKDKLSGEYKEVFYKTEMYVLSQNADNDTTEERLGELLDVFLSAEESGKPVEKIVGNDLESFCRSLCSDFSLKNRLLNFADFFKILAWCWIIESLASLLSTIISWASDDSLDAWYGIEGFNIGYFIGSFILLLAVVLSNSLKHRIMFKTKSTKRLWMISLSAIILGSVIMVLLICWNVANRFTLPVWLLFAVSSIYLLFYYFAIKKRSKRRKIKFTDLVSEEMRKDFPKEMEKKLEKARRKSLKKGNGELSVEDFLNKEEKECDVTEKQKALYYGFPPVISVLILLMTYFTDGFESVIDVILLFVICLSVEYLIMVGMWRIVKSGITQRREWIAKKREEIKSESDNG